MKQFIIYSAIESQLQEEEMYWSNTYGWTTKDQADSFSEFDKESMFLPDTGIWEEVEIA